MWHKQRTTQSNADNAQRKDLMNMKRRIALLLAAALSLFLVACGGNGESETRDATLTITKADGTEETVTSEELMDIYGDNEINYNNNYRGCEATVVGYVLEIEQDRREIFKNVWADTAEITLEGYNGTRGIEFWVVMEDDSYQDMDFTAITKGTKVQVVGTVGESFVNTELDDAHDFEIVTE